MLQRYDFIERSLKINLLVWEFYKDMKNCRQVRVTPEQFERIRIRNDHLLDYIERETAEKEKYDITSSDVGHLISKALLTGIFIRFRVRITRIQMSLLFGKARTTITEHIQNVFKEGELDEKVVSRNFRHTTQHGAIVGKTQETLVKYYNLDVIISVGSRVKSPQGTQFRN